MPHIVTSLKRSANYSHCPLKKRPIKYDPVEDSDSDISYKGIPSPQSVVDCSEPENLSTKPEDLRLASKESSSSPSASPSSSITPPPIALVAGRGGDNSNTISHYTNSHHFSGSYCGIPSPPHSHQHHHHPHHHASQFSPNYLAVPQPLKPVSSGGPLEPISLNAPTAWSKLPAVASQLHHNYSPSASSRSYLDFAPVSSSSSFSARSVVIPQFHSTSSPSHFAPFGGRDASGSPPHVSPPLNVEPAYPVIKIEEAHRPRAFSHHHQQLHSESRHYEEITPVAAHQQHHYIHHHEQPPTKVIKRESHAHCYPSPPNSLKSEGRDSVISHSSVSSSSSSSSSSSPVQTQSPPQLSQITPINVNGSVRYQCPDCNKSYSTFSGLSKHIQFHCASQNKKQFICKFCDKVYVSLGALKMHIRTHTLPCKCNMCGKAFSRPWLLQGHIRTHTGEKPFSCQHCNRAFADRSNLRAHLQTHSEVKKYSCKACSKTFSRMSLLVKHEDSGCAASGNSGSASN